VIITCIEVQVFMHDTDAANAFWLNRRLQRKNIICYVAFEKVIAYSFVNFLCFYLFVDCCIVSTRQEFTSSDDWNCYLSYI